MHKTKTKTKLQNTKLNKNTKQKQTKKQLIINNKNNKNIKKNISILSYNISWESVSGSDKNWSLCNNNTDKSNPKHFSVCVNNISSVFDNNNTLDFITLQEATDYHKLINESSRLKNMKYEVHKSGLDTIVTFWDSKYKLQNKIVGEFENGRPWMATLYKSGTIDRLCIVNVHMGHYNTEEEFSKMVEMMIEIKKGIEMKEMKEMKEKNKNKIRYIISGDFNYDIKEFGDSRNSFKLDNTKFYFNPTHILTCCINRRKHYDHVIDSLRSPIDITIPKVNFLASDHKPILVEIKL